MSGWKGWLAALGGLLVIVDIFLLTGWLNWVGAIVSVVFGAMAAMHK